MSTVRAAGVFGLHGLGWCICISVCACVVKIHHYAPPVGARGSNVWPVAHHWAIWLMRMDGKWKCPDSQSFHDKRLKNYSVCEWFYWTASIHPITWRQYLFQGFFSRFPFQGQNHIYPLSIVSRNSVLHAYSVLPQCIPNPVSNFSSKTLPSINRTHICPHYLRKVSQKAFAC